MHFLIGHKNIFYIDSAVSVIFIELTVL